MLTAGFSKSAKHQIKNLEHTFRKEETKRAQYPLKNHYADLKGI